MTATATQPTTTDHLPTPDERPDTDVVIYDGRCPFCTAQARKLDRWDSQHTLSYLSLDDPEVYRRWPDLSRERLLQSVLVIDRRGRRYWGPEAVRYLSRHLRRLWWASPFLHFPGSMYVWRPLYRWVSCHRYFLGSADECDDGACEHHRHGN